MSEDEITQYIEEHFDEVYKDCMKDCDGDEDIFVFQYMIKKFKKEMEQEKEKNKELSEELTERICKNVEAEVFEEMRLGLKQEKEKNKNLIKQLQEQNTEIQDISKQLREKEKEVVLVPEGTCFMMKPKNSISKDKITSILGLEKETTEQTILQYIETLESENARLEDIEDKKVQIEYEFVFNKGVNSMKDKIKEKIEEIKAKKDFPEFADYEWSDTEKILFHQADILDDLLEEE